MKKKIKIALFFLVCLVIVFSMVITALQLKIIEFEQPISKMKTENENNIVNSPPKASYTYTNDLYTVTFVDKSTDKDNDILTYNWDFGDGEISTEQNAIYTFDCSETNVFDITLTVSDGESNDVYTEEILFGSHLDIIDYSQIWTGYDSYEELGIYEPVWIGDISMTIKNTGNIPAEISYARIESKERNGNYPAFSTKIFFNFTYTYEEVVDVEENGFKQEIIMEFISNNTLTLLPSKIITLTSNPDLTYVTWGVGAYPVNIWLYEKRNGKDISHTLHETVVELT